MRERVDHRRRVEIDLAEITRDEGESSIQGLGDRQLVTGEQTLRSLCSRNMRESMDFSLNVKALTTMTPSSPELRTVAPNHW